MTLASVALALLLGEWAVRLTVPQQLVMLRPDIWRPDSLLGHRHQENADTRVNVGAGTVRFVTDAQGFRVAPAGGAPGATEPAILMLGDSFIEALGVEAEAAIPELVRAMLQERGGPKVHVDNAAVGGWDPNQYLLEARRALLRRRYALGVVFLFVGNDIISSRADSYPPRPYATRHHWRWPRNARRGEIVDALFYPVNDALETRSHLYVLFKESLRVQLAKVGLTPFVRIPELFVKSRADAPAWTVTADICKDIDTAFAQHGASALFVLLPTNYQVDEKVFHEYVESFGTDPDSVSLTQPNARLQDEFQKRGLRLLDPLPQMRRETADGTRLYPRADIHLNENGHRVVAALVAPEVERLLAARSTAP